MKLNKEVKEGIIVCGSLFLFVALFSPLAAVILLLFFTFMALSILLPVWLLAFCISVWYSGVRSAWNDFNPLTLFKEMVQEE